MRKLPRRASLVAQTKEILREMIANGTWDRWLPGEVELSQRLGVSRMTLRAALAELERARWVRAGQGKRRELTKKAQRRVTPGTENRSVVLISPVALHHLPTPTIYWIDELREHMDAAGWPLEVRESAAAYRARPGHALDELAGRLKPAGWVLYRSTPGMQKWFSEKGHLAVVAGSTHPEIGLPAVDKDYRACCRHAAGKFRAAGHQHLAVVRPESSLAGDMDSVAGFQEGVGANVVEAVHDGTVRGIARSLERLFAAHPQITGLFVFHAAHLLTVFGWLQRRGTRVPDDVSLICRDDEPFLASMLPCPARYSLSPALYARKISRLVADLVTGSVLLPRQYRIMPAFECGETLTAPVK